MSTNQNRGSQDVSLHWSQEATSSNLNQLLHGIMQTGVYRGGKVSAQLLPKNSTLEGASEGGFFYIVETGTTLLFQDKRWEDERYKNFIVKVNTNAEVAVPLNINLPANTFLIAVWEFSENDGEHFADFKAVAELPADSGTYILLAKLGNLESAYSEDSAEDLLSSITYDYTEIKNSHMMEKLFEVNSNFPISCYEDGSKVVIGNGKALIRGSFVNITSGLEAPVPIEVCIDEIEEGTLLPALGQYDFLYMEKKGELLWVSVPFYRSTEDWVGDLTNKDLNFYNNNHLLGIFQRPLAQVIENKIFGYNLLDWSNFTPVTGSDKVEEFDVEKTLLIPVED